MNKIGTSIDILKLQGAQRMTSKSGRDIIVIDMAGSRLKPHNNGSVYLALDVVERKDGADDYGKTHFVVEPVTKQEREDGVKLPIIGNGKAWGDGPGAKKPTQREAPRREDQPARATNHEDDDEIPF